MRRGYAIAVVVVIALAAAHAHAQTPPQPAPSADPTAGPQEKTEAPPTSEPTSPTQSTSIEDDAAHRPGAHTPKPVAASSPADSAPEEHSGILWTWGAGAATIVLGGTALGLWIAADAERDALQEKCDKMNIGRCDESNPKYDLDDSRLNRLETLTIVALIGTGLAAAATVTLLVIELDEQADTQVAVSAGQLRFTTRF